MAKESAEKGKNEKKVKRPTPLKRDEQAIKRNARNRAVKSRVNTAIRAFETAVEEGDANVSKAKLSQAHSVLDSAVQKGVLKKNTGNRTKARLHAKLKP